MAKQFLDGAKIATIAKKMRCKGMAQTMRCNMRWQIKFYPQSFKQTLNRASAKWLATAADK
jgi:hypothetical protein